MTKLKAAVGAVLVGLVPTGPQGATGRVIGRDALTPAPILSVDGPLTVVVTLDRFAARYEWQPQALQRGAWNVYDLALAPRGAWVLTRGVHAND